MTQNDAKVVVNDIHVESEIEAGLFRWVLVCVSVLVKCQWIGLNLVNSKYHKL
jgi:hypothetical protein